MKILGCSSPRCIGYALTRYGRRCQAFSMRDVSPAMPTGAVRTRRQTNGIIMKHQLSCVLGTVLWVVAGCVPSLNPLYTLKEVVFDPALIGSWSEEGSTWTFSAK